MAKRVNTLSHERLLELVTYDYNQCKFYRVSKCSRHANNVKQGGEAGGINKQSGYIQLSVDGRKYQAHILLWFYHYKVWPTEFIDHINGIRDDNRIENLRNVPRIVNAQNQKKRQRVNTSLPMGVAVYRKNGEIRGYVAYWNDMGGRRQRVYFPLSVHDSLEVALAAAISRRKSEIANLNKLGADYSERHGT